MTVGSSSSGARRSAAPSGTADAARRVIFGRLQTEDAASAVARRLRTAIGLGVLQDGEKLPKEADLAGQLGVTAFSLREALGTLRAEGLIVTLVGKNGGSYVAHPSTGESLAGDELVRLSATELRDLGDWRTALTTSGARLAALRGAGAVGQTLTTCADDLAAADDAAAARRALGRFHVELAAGAQSMRLTRAELVAHEEFDWLVQVLLRDGQHRRAIAEPMRAVAAAVGAGDADAAWHAGERMVTYLVTELMRARLRMLAAVHRRPRRGARAKGVDLAGELRATFDRTVKHLTAMGSGVGRGVDASPTARDLTAEVARSVLPRLGKLDDTVHGLGFMAEVDVVPGHAYWVEWWQRSADGTFDRDYSHQLDTSRDDFYDYSTKAYMSQVREHGEPAAVGPYIDHGGVDDNIVTVSVPVMTKGRFVGIMAADVRVATLERALSPWLAQAGGVCVVLNAHSRVLLSNSVRYNVGDVLSPNVALTLTPVGCFDWVIGRADDVD